MVPVSMGWNDVGTWEALHEIFPRDEKDNVRLGRVLDRDSRGCVFYAQNRLVSMCSSINSAYCRDCRNCETHYLQTMKRLRGE